MLVKFTLESGILILIVFIKIASSQSASRCEKITTPICQHLGYSTTLMPNSMGHEDQRQAALG
ncbi:hypothetical protein ILUMI_08412, partial [Ignelater luminosus]